MIKYQKYQIKKLKTISFSLVVILTVLLFCRVRSQAITTYQLSSNGNYRLITDNIHVYAMRYSGKEINVSIIDETTCKNITFNALGSVRSVTAYDNHIYALSNDNGKIILNHYTVRNDSVYHYIFEDISLNSDYRFCVVENYVCFMTDNRHQFICTDVQGKRIYDFSIDEEIIDYTVNYDDRQLYLFGRNNIYSVDIHHNGTPKCLLSSRDMRTGISILNNVVFDYSGNITDIRNKTVISSGIQGERNASVINGYCCKYYNGGIEVFLSNSEHYTAYRLNYSGYVQMCSKNNVAYVLSEQGKLAVIGSDALLFRQNTESPSVSDNNATISPDKPDSFQVTNTPTSKSYVSSQTTQDNKAFFISNYKVDEGRGIIWDIPDGTTIATLKKDVVQGSYTLLFRNKDNIVKTSGKLGTGYTMTVQNGENIVCAYRISVKAELTGEGNVNANDIKTMSNYVMQCNDLDELQFVSADLNSDGLVDSQDILLMAEKIHL